MQLRLGRVRLLLFLTTVVVTLVVAADRPIYDQPVSESDFRDRFDIARAERVNRNAIKNTGIYTASTSVFVLSSCNLVTNHIDLPYMAYGSTEFMPPFACFALGIIAGALTVAAHPQYTYTDGNWRWIEERLDRHCPSCNKWFGMMANYYFMELGGICKELYDELRCFLAKVMLIV